MNKAREQVGTKVVACLPFGVWLSTLRFLGSVCTGYLDVKVCSRIYVTSHQSGPWLLVHCHSVC